MTGLDPSTDCILSLSCLITDAELRLLDTGGEGRGFNTTIQTPESKLSAMDDWCTRTHSASGLTAACATSTTTAESAAHDLLAYIQRYVPQPRTALLAGNSIHADRAFLARPPWDAVLQHLHYRVFDVSSIKEAVRRWAPDAVLEGVPRKQARHEARADVEESVAEAAYYMGFFAGGGAASGGGGVGRGREKE